MVRARVSVNKLCECLSVLFFLLSLLLDVFAVNWTKRSLHKVLPCHLHLWNFNSTCISLFIHIFAMFKRPSACCWINAKPKNTNPNGCCVIDALLFYTFTIDFPSTSTWSLFCSRERSQLFPSQIFSNAKHFSLRAIKFSFHCWSCFVHTILFGRWLLLTPIRILLP